MEGNYRTKKTVWEHLWGWQVVGAVSILLLGIGGGIMVSPHPYIADAFFFVGFSLLLVKFWAWEEAKHSTARKTAMLLAGVTLFIAFLFAGSCRLSYYLNLPKQTLAASTPQPKASVPPIAEEPKPAMPPKSSPEKSNHPAKSKSYEKPSAAPNPKPAASALGPRTPEKSVPVVPLTTYQQTCVGSACAQGNGAQATYNQFGPRSWESMLDRDKQNALIKDLGQAQGKIRFTWLFQDLDGMKMVGFLNYAFEQAKWVSEPEQGLGKICYPEKPGDCTGLSIAVRDRKSVIAQTAINAVSAFIPNPHINGSDKVPDGRVEVFVGKAK